MISRQHEKLKCFNEDLGGIKKFKGLNKQIPLIPVHTNEKLNNPYHCLNQNLKRLNGCRRIKKKIIDSSTTNPIRVIEQQIKK
jgi:hypothetical protein